MSDKKFYRDGFRVKFGKGHKFQFIAFDTDEADMLVELLNELLSYKLLVRKHKRDIEAIYGKPIKEQLKDVME